jgi:hypothetical protein
LRVGQKLPKIDHFSKKSSSLQPYMWRKNWMYGDVEQEGLYQNCKIYNPRCSSFAPRAGPNRIYSLLKFEHF